MLRKIIILSSKNSVCDTENTEWPIHIKAPGLFSDAAAVLLYDPRIIAALGGVPEILCPESNDSLPGDGDMYIVSHRASPEEEEFLLERIKEGKAVYWAQPSPEALKAASGGRLRIRDRVPSMCDIWELDGKEFTYPGMLGYDLYTVQGCETEGVLAGEWPVTAYCGKSAFCAADLFHAYMTYWNTPHELLNEGGFIDAFQSAYARCILKLAGAEAEKSAPGSFFMRRDFHAYGFARLMVERLFGIKNLRPDFGKADGLFAVACRAYGEGAGDETLVQLLRPAFEALYVERLKASTLPVYYADALHGGIMTRDYGYIEIAAPEFVRELLTMYLTLGRRRGYHFSLDISMATFHHLARRYTVFFDRLRDAMDEGILELVNGSVGQPYPHLFSGEANIMQFVTGQEIAQRLFKRPVTTLAAQELQLAPGYPQILAGCGIKNALHRIQNKGATIYSDETALRWEDGGKSVLTVPTHRGDSQQSISTAYLFWPELVAEAEKHTDTGIFTNLLDLVWACSFKEEAIRASYYAPVLGRFVTYRELFALLDRPKKPKMQTERADYAAEPQPGTSVMLRDMQECEGILRRAETVSALSGQANAEKTLAAWRALGSYQNHDNTVCFGVEPFDYYACPSRKGPQRRAPLLYDTLKQDAFESALRVLPVGGEGCAPFNMLSMKQNARLFLKNSRWIEPRDMFSLAEAERFVFTEVEPLSYVDVSTSGPVTPRYYSEPVIQNESLRLELDRESGDAVSLLFRGRELLSGPCPLLRAGFEGSTRLISREELSCEAGSQIILRLELRFPDGRRAGEAECAVKLLEGEDMLRFSARLRPEIPRKLYPEAYQEERKASIAASIALLPEFNDVRDCWLDRLNPAPKGNEREMCPGLYYGNARLAAEYNALPVEYRLQSCMGIILSDGNTDLIFHNDGAQIYEVNHGRVSNLLWCGSEYGDSFTWALELAPHDSAPLKRLLSYRYGVKETPRAPIIRKPSVQNAWLSALKPESEHTVLFRLSEITGQAVNAALDPGAPVKSVRFTDMLGNEEAESVTPGCIPLPPHGVRTLRVVYE